VVKSWTWSINAVSPVSLPFEWNSPREMKAACPSASELDDNHIGPEPCCKCLWELARVELRAQLLAYFSVPASVHARVSLPRVRPTHPAGKRRGDSGARSVSTGPSFDRRFVDGRSCQSLLGPHFLPQVISVAGSAVRLRTSRTAAHPRRTRGRSERSRCRRNVRAARGTGHGRCRRASFSNPSNVRHRSQRKTATSVTTRSPAAKPTVCG